MTKKGRQETGEGRRSDGIYHNGGLPMTLDQKRQRDVPRKTIAPKFGTDTNKRKEGMRECRRSRRIECGRL